MEYHRISFIHNDTEYSFIKANLAVTLDIYMNILIRIIQIIRVSGH